MTVAFYCHSNEFSDLALFTSLYKQGYSPILAQIDFGQYAHRENARLYAILKSTHDFSLIDVNSLQKTILYNMFCFEDHSDPMNVFCYDEVTIAGFIGVIDESGVTFESLQSVINNAKAAI